MPIAKRKPWVAGLLSLLVLGLGHAYSGQAKRGACLYCVLWVIVLGAGIITVSLPTPLNIAATAIFIVVGLSVYLYVIIDSVRTARKIGDTYHLKAYNRWYFYVAVVVLSGFVAPTTIGRVMVVQAYVTPAGSMIPTLQVGDHILVNKLSYGVHIPFRSGYIARYSKPKRGDVVAYVYPKDRSKVFVHRVIGVEGDLVEIRKKNIFINGKPLNDPYGHFVDKGLSQGWMQFRDNYGPERVPENNIFVLGDNRDRSHDSRFWGFVDFKDVKGKAFVIYWAWDRGVRWEKIGMEIK